jgi:hypothetical protein
MAIIKFTFYKITDQKPFPTGPVGQTGRVSLLVRYFLNLNIIIAIKVFI